MVTLIIWIDNKLLPILIWKLWPLNNGSTFIQSCNNVIQFRQLHTLTWGAAQYTTAHWRRSALLKDMQTKAGHHLFIFACIWIFPQLIRKFKTTYVAATSQACVSDLCYHWINLRLSAVTLCFLCIFCFLNNVTPVFPCLYRWDGFSGHLFLSVSVMLFWAMHFALNNIIFSMLANGPFLQFPRC